MFSGLAVGFVIALALLAANAPFLTPRRFGVWAPPPAGKSLWWHLLEWALAYLLVGGVALAFEHRMGRIAAQGWEFYAITICLFASFAFPGFVYRYLVRHDSAPSADGA